MDALRNTNRQKLLQIFYTILNGEQRTPESDQRLMQIANDMEENAFNTSGGQLGPQYHQVLKQKIEQMKVGLARRNPNPNPAPNPNPPQQQMTAQMAPQMGNRSSLPPQGSHLQPTPTMNTMNMNQTSQIPPNSMSSRTAGYPMSQDPTPRSSGGWSNQPPNTSGQPLSNQIPPGQMYQGQSPHSGQQQSHLGPSHPTPSHTGQPQPRPSQPHGQPYMNQPHPGQPHPGQPHPGQPHSGQPHSGQSHPGQPHPGQPYSGQSQPQSGQSRPSAQQYPVRTKLYTM